LKKLFFTIFVVLFFSILFVVESAVKAMMKLLGYFSGLSRWDGSFENNKTQESYQHS